MKTALQTVNPSAPAREISVITDEIRTIRQQANSMALFYAIEIGKRLVEAKQALPHGEWGDWLKNEVDFSQSTANNLMRLAEEYGSSQVSLFGMSANSQTFRNLPYSKALQLLAVPADEREAFAEEVHADEISVRELKEAIEARNKAEEEARIEREKTEELEDRLAEAEAKAKEADEKAAEAEEFRRQLAEMDKIAQSERAKANELGEKLKKAQADPKIPKAKLDKLREEAESAAKKETQKELEDLHAKVERAQKAAFDAQRDAQDAKERLEDAQKRLKTASPEVSAFKALFEQLQQTADRLRGMIQEISRNDPETGGKLAAALRAFGGTL